MKNKISGQRDQNAKEENKRLKCFQNQAMGREKTNHFVYKYVVTSCKEGGGEIKPKKNTLWDIDVIIKQG